MCGSMANIHFATLGEEKKKNKQQGKNLMVCPIP